MKKTDHYDGLQSGMTLIEVLISLLLFSLAFLGLVGMQARALQVSGDAEDRNSAALWANEIISTMWHQKQNVATLPSGALATWKTRVLWGLPGGNGDIATDANGVTTVTITWRAPTRKTGSQTSQYITQVVLP